MENNNQTPIEQNTAPVQAPVNPYASPAGYYAAPTVQTVEKRGAGKIIAMIVGILLTLIGLFLGFCLAIVDIDDYMNKGAANIVIPAYIVVFVIPVVLGIILIVFGAKKRKVTVFSTPTTTYGSTATYAPTTTYGPTTAYTTPVSTAAPVTPVAENTVTENTVAEIPTTASDVSETAAAATPIAAAPAATVSPTTTPMAYDYAPTAPLQDQSADVAKKEGRKQGLIAIGCIVLLWILIFVLDRLFWYLAIIPFVCSFSGLKANIKSVASWFGMILSILSALAIVALLLL